MKKTYLSDSGGFIEISGCIIDDNYLWCCHRPGDNGSNKMVDPDIYRLANQQGQRAIIREEKLQLSIDIRQNLQES